MTLDQAWNWFEDFTNLEKNPQNTKRVWRLDRMEKLLLMAENPHKGRLTIHVAGSKGKGSTCALLASLFTEAGFKTGLYASPHIVSWKERITLNGLFFSDQAYLSAFEKTKALWENLEPQQKNNFIQDFGGAPSTFELLTLMAFILFKEQNCDAQIIETGLGGRLDATNVLSPEASILTLIEYEHTDILGNTLPDIATEKAGIIKPKTPVFTAFQTTEVLHVFHKMAQVKEAPFFVLDSTDALRHIKQTSRKTILDIGFITGKKKIIPLGIQGLAQGKNAALAVWSFYKLRELGVWQPKALKPSMEEIIVNGLTQIQTQGRFEKAHSKPVLILDGAHTKSSCELLAQSWVKAYGSKGTLIFGAFSGKDISGMTAVLAKHFHHVIVCPPGFYRPSEPDQITASFQKMGVKSVFQCKNPSEAWELAQSFHKPTLACGSFYLVGEIKKTSKDFNIHKEIKILGYKHAREIKNIFNDAIINTTALYDYRPKTDKEIHQWIRSKIKHNFPLWGIVDANNNLLGFGTYGTFRDHPAFKYTVELSIYINKEYRGRGLGKTLLQRMIQQAQTQGYHCLVSCIDADNENSIKLHTSLGFQYSGNLKQVGYKFEHWLNMDLYQLLLETPLEPNENES